MAPPSPGGTRSPNRHQPIAERPWPDGQQEQYPALCLQRIQSQAGSRMANSSVLTAGHTAIAAPTLELGKPPLRVAWRLLHRRSRGFQPGFHGGGCVPRPLVDPLRGSMLITSPDPITCHGFIDESSGPEETAPPMKLIVLARAHKRWVDNRPQLRGCVARVTSRYARDCRRSCWQRCRQCARGRREWYRDNPARSRRAFRARHAFELGPTAPMSSSGPSSTTMASMRRHDRLATLVRARRSRSLRLQTGITTLTRPCSPTP